MAPAPSDPTLLEVERAVRDARKELEELQAGIAKDLDAAGARVAAEEARVRDLRQKDLDQASRLRQAEGELEKLEQKLTAALEAKSRAEDGLDVLRGELESQINGFNERFASSLAAIAEPGLLATAGEIKAGLETLQRSELPARITRWTGVLERVLGLARSVGPVQVAIQLPGEGGRIDQVEGLRMGLLGGYYSRPQGGDAGFILTDLEGKTGFKAESTGISAVQKAEIARLVANPSAGGNLPSDVSGGAGIAALQTRESFLRWFELGGFCMWPLLAVALSAVCLIIERAVVLTAKALGMKRRIRHVLALVRAGKAEAAEEYCSRLGGPVGGVLHAALVHRGKDRSIMEDSVQEALLHHAPQFQTRLSFIALCAAVAPLFGLLGTVTGMITTFKMVTLFGTSDPRFMAGGISEALITTEAGLWIAIPSLLCRGLLGALAEGALGTLESGALSVVLELSRRVEPEVAVEEAA